ncbi:MAG: flagellar hook-associated protein FlgK [Bacteroidetes bacterium]|nr:flagellar hook-associated protein FlgK [Bacteroidota bacterium]
MGGLNSILNIGSGALMTSQAELDTTAHNIANANTDGYTRQEVMTEASAPIQMSYGYVGSGVTITGIKGIRDAFVNEQVTNMNSDLSQANIEQQVGSTVEGIFNETSNSTSGLVAQLNALFGAFQTLSQTPEDAGVRQTVLQAGQNVATTFNSLNNQLTDASYQVGQQIGSDVTKINQLAGTIAGINKQILANSGTSGASSDLQDQLNNAVTQLSNLINVKVVTDANGTTNVTAGGAVLVAAGTAFNFKMTQTASGITIGRSDSTVPATVSSGEIAGLLNSYDNLIPSFSSQLDSIANTLVKTVNAFNSAGYTLPAGGAAAQTGKTFFQGTSAGSIAISPDILNNLNNIAASSNGDPGNGENAAAMANVLNAPVMGNGQSIMDAYQALVNQVGTASQNASNSVQTLQIQQNQLTAFQTSISGVSLDQELTNMIQFQHSFEAAAKVVTTADSMYQTVIGMVS